jgi:hypothetical protein
LKGRNPGEAEDQSTNSEYYEKIVTLSNYCRFTKHAKHVGMSDVVVKATMICKIDRFGQLPKAG